MKIENKGSVAITIPLDQSQSVTIAAGATSGVIPTYLMPPNRMQSLAASVEPGDIAIHLTDSEFKNYAAFMPPSISEIGVIDANADV